VAAADGLAASLVDLATGVAVGGKISPEDDDDRRTAGGGSSSPDGPDESLRKVCLRFTTFGGGIETAETVGFEGASPVGLKKVLVIYFLPDIP
jgi:hypothetical protein